MDNGNYIKYLIDSFLIHVWKAIDQSEEIDDVKILLELTFDKWQITFDNLEKNSIVRNYIFNSVLIYLFNRTIPRSKEEYDRKLDLLINKIFPRFDAGRIAIILAFRKTQRDYSAKKRINELSSFRVENVFSRVYDGIEEKRISNCKGRNS